MVPAIVYGSASAGGESLLGACSGGCASGDANALSLITLAWALPQCEMRALRTSSVVRNILCLDTKIGDNRMKEIGIGTLILMDWMEDVDCKDVKGFYGKVSVGTDEEIVGFKATGHNTANWVARVEGETEAITVMGCQVRAFREGKRPEPASQMKVLI